MATGTTGLRVTGLARSGGLAALLGALGCTSTTDLGTSTNGGFGGVPSAPVVYADSPPVFASVSGGAGSVVPFKLVSGGIVVADLWAQGERISWGWWLGASQSCSVQNCAATVESVAAPVENGLVNALYFPEDGWPEKYRVQVAEPGISGAGYSLGSILLFDGEFAYASEPSNWILRCRAVDCNNTVVKIPLRSPVGAEPVFDGHPTERLFVDETYLYASNSQDVVRVNKAGPFVDQNGDHVEYEPLIHRQDYIGGVKLYGDRFFWGEEDSAGRVRACSKTGCIGEPEFITPATIGYVSVFAFDGEQMYLLQSVSVENPMGRILRCPIADCSTPTVLLESLELQSSPLLVHGDLLFFVGTERNSSGATAYIGAIPK